MGEIDAAHPRAVPQGVESLREGLAVADGGNEEHETGIDELAEHRRRSGVNEVGVVDEQHQRTALYLRAQDVADLRDDRDEVAALRGEAGWQERRQDAERNTARTLRRRGPGDGSALAVGDRQTLIGQARLSDARRAVDHEAVGARIAEGRREQVDLFVSTYQRPLQRQRGLADGGAGHRPRTVSPTAVN